MKYVIVVSLFIFCLTEASAQDKNANIILGKSIGYNLINIGIETSTTAYINTETKDSSGVQLYLAPYFDYNHKSGFGIKLKTFVLPSGSDPGFYLSSISPYFAKYNGKIYPYISFTRFLQHTNPSIPYSPISNEIYAQARFKTKYVDIKTGFDVGFGNDKEQDDILVSDVNTFVALSHLYIIEKIGKNNTNLLGILPSLQLNAGTDRYFKYLQTTKYISQNRNANAVNNTRGNGNHGNGSTVPIETSTISLENDFGISNLEANLYVIYFFGDFSIEPSGSLYFPLRGIDKTPFAYWQLNLNYWFQ
jgi:hypothetical protein